MDEKTIQALAANPPPPPQRKTFFHQVRDREARLGLDRCNAAYARFGLDTSRPMLVRTLIGKMACMDVIEEESPATEPATPASTAPAIAAPVATAPASLADTYMAIEDPTARAKFYREHRLELWKENGMRRALQEGRTAPLYGTPSKKGIK